MRMSCLLSREVGDHRNLEKCEYVMCQTVASLTLNTTLTNIMTLANYSF